MVNAGLGGDYAGGGAGSLWLQRWASTLSIVARGRRGGHALHEWLVAGGARFLGLRVVEAGLCAWAAATAIDHMQMLTDEVEERTRQVVGRDGGASLGRAVLSRRIGFRLCLRNGSCEPKRESVEMTDLLPDSVEWQRLYDGAPWGT